VQACVNDGATPQYILEVQRLNYLYMDKQECCGEYPLPTCYVVCVCSCVIFDPYSHLHDPFLSRNTLLVEGTKLHGQQ
jgi:hypothetical protein